MTMGRGSMSNMIKYIFGDAIIRTKPSHVINPINFDVPRKCLENKVNELHQITHKLWIVCNWDIDAFIGKTVI